jgi:hypothetical protein
MASLPELKNHKRYWLEIWCGDSAWKTEGPGALVPTRDHPQIPSISPYRKPSFLRELKLYSNKLVN